MKLFNDLCKIFAVIVCCTMAVAIVFSVILVAIMPLIIFAFSGSLWSLFLYFIFAIIICNSIYNDVD